MDYPVIKSDGTITFPTITENNNKYFLHNWCHTISDVNIDPSTGEYGRKYKPMDTLFYTRNDTVPVSVITLPTDEKYSHQEIKDLIESNVTPLGYTLKSDSFLNTHAYIFLQNNYVEKNGINDNQQIDQFTY